MSLTLVYYFNNGSKQGSLVSRIDIALCKVAGVWTNVYVYVDIYITVYHSVRKHCTLQGSRCLDQCICICRYILNSISLGKETLHSAREQVFGPMYMYM